MTLATRIRADYKRAIARVGEDVTFRRITGQAPNTTQVEATVKAVVRDYIPEAALLDVRREGRITEGGKHLIVINGDLLAQGFPVPLRKNDQVVVREEVLTISQLDVTKRALGDAVELVAVGALAG